MNWINVSYNSNQTYIVQESALLNAIELVISSAKNVIKSSVPKLEIDPDHSNLNILIEIKLKNITKEHDPYSIVKDLTFDIEESVRALIDKKPKNVQVILLDIY
ncbi:MMB_0454 family protein [Mycoplasma nasistruthionis]|uniref:Asp23/Gls24 family envelope stress response protein n=1 Tax=Mycoplasma nasistruthionis TaxID=353852 RepID=A0A4Y6I6N2_9MOLU|nr:hypothetical protein [Mycoplasma nasistruthionis]QCZ36561.1 hypothetical protein FG904_00820 [Mycoplasma nasistruthionis]QDF64859.1 hypothetical protein FIV53_00835 [Mycoplasma nasistruthionis]